MRRLRKVFATAYGDRVPGAPLSPMLATAGTLPRGPGWSYEFKWDGVRVLSSFTGGPPQLWARSGAVVTTRRTPMEVRNSTSERSTSTLL